MPDFPSEKFVAPLIDLAFAEDMGPDSDDCTSRLSIPDTLQGVGTLVLKKPGVVAGLPVVKMVCERYDRRLNVSDTGREGSFVENVPTELMTVRGPLRSLLSAERVLLNFVQRLSGIATLTRQYVKAVEGTAAGIYDTRKTIPGHRMLEKYAVAAGGGKNHRVGLYDMVLLKDNHLAAVEPAALAKRLREIVAVSRAEKPDRPIEVEVDTLEQFDAVLTVGGVDMILLDNMPAETMREAVRRRDAAGLKAKVQLEASGGITGATLRPIAESGVDRISVGALTHSAIALDIGLDVVAV